MPGLSAAERAAFLERHPEWVLEGEVLVRTFRFTDFAAAMGFVTQVALRAEVADHHPDIDVRWNTVRLALTTHDAEALTGKDTELATAFEQLL
jgi:4a-hydroxytetrahydrobiopterin dehydratase